MKLRNDFLAPLAAILFATTLVFLLVLGPSSFLDAQAQGASSLETSRIVRLSGNAFVTDDLDASIDFYTKFLDFEVVRRFDLTAASKEIYGVNGDEKIEYAALKPAGWPLDTPGLSGLNFAQVTTADENPIARNEQRVPYYGEFILTYEVRDIENIASEMRTAGVPIVTELSPSATGKSMTLTFLDPNGIRVHLYDYL